MNAEDRKMPEENDNVRIIEGDGVTIIMLDGPGDTTVRPPRPVLLKLGLETQAKIAKWQAEEKERQAKKRQEPKK